MTYEIAVNEHRAELRRLLAESARPGEVFQVAYGHHYDYAVHDQAGWTVAECAGKNWVRLIAAAVNALPDLLDALEKAEAAIERVREMHYAADNDPARTPRCEECEGRAGTHPCGCWAPEDRQPVCGHCNDPERGQTVPWPCPTVQALDGGGSDE